MANADDYQKLQKAISLHQRGNLNEAEHLYRELIKLNPQNFHALHFLGIIEAGKGHIEKAKILMARSLSMRPPNIQFIENYATILFQAGEYDAALRTCQQGLQVSAGHISLLYVSAISLFKQNRLKESITQFDRLIAIQPNHVAAINERGSAFALMKQYADAYSSFDRALSLSPQYAEAHLNKGNLHSELGRYDEALAAYDKVLQLRPDVANAWLGRGNVYRELKRYDDSFFAYEKALALRPDLAEAWLGRGNAFFELKHYDEALAAYDQALALRSDLAEAWNGRGNVFVNRKLHAEAFAAYERALALDPSLAQAWLGRGNVFLELRQHGEALTNYDKALALMPNLDRAWFGRGNALADLKRYDEAVVAYNKALAAGAEGARFLAKMNLCDWNDYDAEREHLLAAVREGSVITAPFALLSIPSSPADLLHCAQRYAADKYPTMPPVWQGERYGHDRVRIAYLSSDFRLHAIAYLIAEVIELHDRKKFEIIGISLGPDDKSDMRQRITRSFDRFHDVRGQNDDAVAQLVRDLEIDILIDLNNYSDMCRPGILARRPAPIQSSYLGYPSSMGADFIDYAIADKFVLSREQQEYWTEKIVYLPDSYLAHDTKTKRNMPAQPPTRAQVGLPEEAFVFCCFNNAFKIKPPIFQVWMRLLKAVEGSVGWLSPAGDSTQSNLRKEAAAAGIDPARLIFAPKLERIEDHLSRHRVADLFLDTLPYNAHTTAADALWAGLPVVTCAGETFAARVAGSLLNAIGLPELVTVSLEDYEALALQLARDPDRLAAVKVKLARNRDSYPLFDTARFTRHLEAAYVEMVARQRRGEPPASFAIRSIG